MKGTRVLAIWKQTRPEMYFEFLSQGRNIEQKSILFTFRCLCPSLNNVTWEGSYCTVHALVVPLKELSKLGISKDIYETKDSVFYFPFQYRLPGSNKGLEERCIFLHWNQPASSIKNKQKKLTEETRENCIWIPAPLLISLVILTNYLTLSRLALLICSLRTECITHEWIFCEYEWNILRKMLSNAWDIMCLQQILVVGEKKVALVMWDFVMYSFIYISVCSPEFLGFQQFF